MKIKEFKNKLYIKDFKPKNLRNLIWKMTQEPETRWDNGRIQCLDYHHRSLTDIYNVAKSYYPDCSVDQVFYHLARLCWKGYCIGNYCSEIQKPVFYPKSIYDGEYDGNIMMDYFPKGTQSREVAEKLLEIQEEHKNQWENE